MKNSVKIRPISDLPAIDKDGDLNVVVETAQGSRNKYEYDFDFNCFKLSSILTEGSVFPFDFGFVPSTKGGDGDPLDVLLLIDEPSYPGCIVKARLIGAIQAEQTKQSKKEKNDRLVAVAKESHRYRRIKSLRDLDPKLLREIEHFFISYNVMKGKEFKVQGRIGPTRAIKLVEKNGNS